MPGFQIANTTDQTFLPTQLTRRENLWMPKGFQLALTVYSPANIAFA